MLETIVKEDINRILINTKIKWNKFKNASFLITGANGFIANYIINTLIYLNFYKKYNIKIILLTRNKIKTKKKFINTKTSKFIKIINHNLLTKVKIKDKIDYVFHSASQASPKFYLKNPISTILPNVLGTYNVLNLCKNKKIKSFLYFSSGEIYGNSRKKLVEDTIHETPTLNPRSCYTQSKKMGETISHSFLQEKKVPTKIIRIFHTYGPGMDLNDGRVMMDFVKEIVINNQITVKSSGKQKRSFCYIGDMISAIFLVLIKGKNGEAYNAGNPKEFMSIKLLAQKISNKINGIKIVYKERSKKDFYIKSTIDKVNPSVKKISKLKFSPKINVETGFLRTIEYFKKKNIKNS